MLDKQNYVTGGKFQPLIAKKLMIEEVNDDEVPEPIIYYSNYVRK